ncbi:unnamed protein product [Closterium sp. NIES-65]|nr:unnamed protein product [Closterium sp. NIES-65]
MVRVVCCTCTRACCDVPLPFPLLNQPLEWPTAASLLVVHACKKMPFKRSSPTAQSTTSHAVPSSFSTPNPNRCSTPRGTCLQGNAASFNAPSPRLNPPLLFTHPTPSSPLLTPAGPGRLVVLDASWYMPAEKRQPFEEFQHGRIPGAIFFDIDAIADPTTDLPHMLPTEAAFSAAASALGLSSSDSIVVYDGKGLFSAARAWWMFRAFGQPHVAVLDGGLPAWRAAGYPVEAEPSDKAAGRHKAAATAIKDSYSTKAASNRLLTFNAKLQPNLILSVDQVKANIENKVYQVSDARSAGRFKGIDPEPRAGVRGGSIPGSFNVPFPEVLTPQGQLKPASDLTQAFKSAGVSVEDPKQPLAASCGTGVTACVLALALARLGRWDVPVYDGSWTEWGSLQDTPVVKAE